VEKIIKPMIVHVCSKQIQRKEAINMLKIYKNHNNKKSSSSSSLVQILFMY